jgi:hypothetical protein
MPRDALANRREEVCVLWEEQEARHVGDLPGAPEALGPLARCPAALDAELLELFLERYQPKRLQLCHIVCILDAKAARFEHVIP